VGAAVTELPGPYAELVAGIDRGEGSLPGKGRLPAKNWANSGRLSSAGSSPISPATSALAATR
jgi:hypothetical protein